MRFSRWVWALAALILAPAAMAQKARIAIVIDDVGYSQRNGVAFIALPGPVALAFLPDALYTPRLAVMASEAGKPVMLHAPMQALRNVDRRPRCHRRAPPPDLLNQAGFERSPESEPDPALAADVAFVPPCEAVNLMRAELRMEHSEAEFRAVFAAQLKRVPGAIGVNNHEGSRLTQDGRAMNWLMDALLQDGQLYFLDSRTSGRSIAYETAQERRVPALKRDVFLDNVASYVAINRRFDQMLRIAEKHGSALAIGHPYRATLEVLKVRLRDLDTERFELVSPAELLPAPELPMLRAAVPGHAPSLPVRAGRSPRE